MRLRQPAELAAAFEAAGADAALSTVASCGSGVTACVIALAREVMREAGLPIIGDTAVYDGSWSHYAADPEAPIERG